MSQVGLCPICREVAEVTDMFGHDAVQVACARCSPTGRLSVGRTVTRQLEAADTELMPYLSAYTRQATDRGERVVIHTGNWRDLARAHRGTSISRRRRMLLESLAHRSVVPGASVPVDYETDASLIDARNGGEFRFHLESLEKAGLVEINRGTSGPSGLGAVITATGWDLLEPSDTQGIPGRCFVAMSFDDSLTEAWQLGIFLAVKDDCKCEPVRIDLVEHNPKICDRIIAEIRRAQFVVADFTLHRQNVYFEAGFAMALGRPVVWTCREDELPHAHFDTRQYSYVVWATPQDLRSKLATRIQATILGA